MLQPIAEGHDSGDIAARLMITSGTVGLRREHIMQKLDLNSVATLTN